VCVCVYVNVYVCVLYHLYSFSIPIPVFACVLLLSIYFSLQELKKKDKIVDPELLAAEKSKEMDVFKRKAFDEIKAAVQALHFSSTREAKSTTHATRVVNLDRVLRKLREMGLVDTKEEDVLFENGTHKSDRFGKNIVNVKLNVFGVTETCQITFDINPIVKAVSEADSTTEKAGKRGKKERGFRNAQ
jgi:hypothetical protein